MDNLIKDEAIPANDFSNQSFQKKPGFLILTRRIGETICIGDVITPFIPKPMV